MGQCGTIWNNMEQCGTMWNKDGTKMEQRWNNVQQCATMRSMHLPHTTFDTVVARHDFIGVPREHEVHDAVPAEVPHGLGDGVKRRRHRACNSGKSFHQSQGGSSIGAVERVTGFTEHILVCYVPSCQLNPYLLLPLDSVIMYPNDWKKGMGRTNDKPICSDAWASD